MAILVILVIVGFVIYFVRYVSTARIVEVTDNKGNKLRVTMSGREFKRVMSGQMLINDVGWLSNGEKAWLYRAGPVKFK